jgi:hypothetical protein
MIFIGNIELPIVASVEEGSEAEEDEIKSELDSVVVKHEPSVKSVTITGFMNQELHSSSLSLDEQKAQLNSLRDKSKLENTFVYRSYKGHLFIEEVNISQNSNSRIVNEFEIVARYFPWPKYVFDGYYNFGDYSDGEYGFGDEP